MNYGGRAKERSRIESVVQETVPDSRSSEALRIAFKDNPTPRPEEMRFIAENSRIHRRFVRDIMGANNGRKADVVVFTGSTYDVAADPLTVGAYLEGFDPAELPDFASWNSMRYFDRHDAAPNSLVYKYVSRGAIAEAGNTLALASVLETQKEKWQSEIDELLKDEDQAFDHLNRLASEGRAYGFPKDQYIFGKLVSALREKDLYKRIPGEYHSQITAMESLVIDAEAVLQNYADELEELQTTVREIATDVNTGVTSEASDQPGSFKVPQDKRRIALLKSLYPEYVKALFHEDGTPKEIVFYDNVSISGEKTSAYLEFFRNLGIADHVRVYIMYTKPGAKYGFPRTETEVHVGEEITENFVVRSVDNKEDAKFMGREHDRKTRYQVPQIAEHKATPDEIAENRRKQVLTLAEQLLLPEQLDRVVSEMKKWSEQSKRDGTVYDRLVCNYLDSEELFPRIVTPSYKDYEPEEYSEFEKSMGWEISEEKKKYVQTARKALEYLSDQFANSGQNQIRVLLLDSDIHLLIEGFLRTPQFAHLKGKIIYDDVYTLSDQISKKTIGKLDPMFTVCIGNKFPTYQVSQMRTIAENGTSLDSVILFGDGRREYSEEKRVTALQELQKKLGSSVHNFEAKLQNAQAYSEAEVSQAFKDRMIKATRVPTMGDFQVEGLREVFKGGADVLQADIRAAHEKSLEYGLTEQFFETPEYKAFEKHMVDIVRWQTQLYEEIVSELEAIAQWPSDTDLQGWGEAIPRLRTIEQKVRTISQLEEFLRQQKVGINYGETKWGIPPSTLFEVSQEFTHIQYEIERLIEEVQKHLTAKYVENYLPDEYPNLHVQSDMDSMGLLLTRVYDTDLKDRDKLVSRSVAAAKSIETFRYLTEVAAFQDSLT